MTIQDTLIGMVRRTGVVADVRGYANPTSFQDDPVCVVDYSNIVFDDETAGGAATTRGELWWDLVIYGPDRHTVNQLSEQMLFTLRTQGGYGGGDETVIYNIAPQFIDAEPTDAPSGWWEARHGYISLADFPY